MDTDAIYRKLGELVVSFQWLENILQQIAWVLIEPEWENDPRKETAGLWFKDLVDLVSKRFIDYIDTHNITSVEHHKSRFSELLEQSKKVAKYRNRIVHSTYVELKAGGEIQGLIRSKINRDINDEGVKILEFDQEHLNDSSFDNAMIEIGKVGFELGIMHRQLISWHGSVDPKTP